MVKFIYYQLYYTQITGKRVTLPTTKNGQRLNPSFLNNKSVANITSKFHTWFIHLLRFALSSVGLWPFFPALYPDEERILRYPRAQKSTTTRECIAIHVSWDYIWPMRDRRWHILKFLVLPLWRCPLWISVWFCVFREALEGLV